MDTLTPTTVVAIYAAFIATVALGWNIYNILRNRAHLQVTVSFGYIVNSLRRSPTQVIFEAANIGRRPITLTGVGIILPDVKDGRNLGQIHAPGDFPCKIGEGEKHTCSFELGVLQVELKKSNLSRPPKIAWFRDATGRLHKGRIPKNVGMNLLYQK